MQGEALSASVTVTNPQGFHMRATAAFVKLANRFQRHVSLYNADNQRFDGKSAISLLGLLAEPGAELTLEVRGPDQEQAFQEHYHLMTHLTELECEGTEAAGD